MKRTLPISRERAALHSTRAHMREGMRPRARRGFAMITALWLIIAITVVALQFSLEAHERYTLGINASERGVARAAAMGALALEQARLERALRTNTSGSNAARLRSSDPWLDVDSTYSGPVDIDSIEVMVDVKAGGRRLNINTMQEDQLKAFFSYLLSDFTVSDELAQSILDWRDNDDQARSRGGERDAYLKDNRMVLPSNAPFREVDDLLDVKGMTPEILAKARPYLRTYGGGPVNLNTAEAPVLRAIPGMTDALLTRILAARSNGGRIRSLADIGVSIVQPPQGGRGAPPPTAQQTLGQRVAANSTVNTDEVELVLVASAGQQAIPARLTATISRNGNNTSITWRQW